MESWVRRWGPAILIMVLIFIASSATGRELPHFGAWDMTIKKIGHLVGYALLAAAYFRALTKGMRGVRRTFLLALFLAVLYSVSDEFHQKFTPGRAPTVIDVAIDTAGATIGLCLSVSFRGRFRSRHAIGRLEDKR